MVSFQKETVYRSVLVPLISSSNIEHVYSSSSRESRGSYTAVYYYIYIIIKTINYKLFSGMESRLRYGSFTYTVFDTFV
jgi:hypothetical protein